MREFAVKEVDTSGWNFTTACPKLGRGPLEIYNYNSKISSHTSYFEAGLQTSPLADTVGGRAAAGPIEDPTRGSICLHEVVYG